MAKGEHYAEEVPRLTVRELMTNQVVTVGPETAVNEIAQVLVEHNISGVPVVDAAGKVVGLVTEADLIVRDAVLDMPTYVAFLDTFVFLGGTREFDEELRRALGTHASEVMSAPVVTVAPETTATDLATLMVERKVNPVPVVDASGALIGIVSRSDLVRLMAREQETGRALDEEGGGR